MDNLKKYLQEHRARLDNQSPDSSVKERVFYSLGKSRKSSFRLYRSLVAAATLAAIITGGYLVSKDTPRDMAKIPAKEENGLSHEVPALKEKKEGLFVREAAGISHPNSRDPEKRKPEQAPFPGWDDLRQLGQSYASQIDHQVAQLNILPLFTQEPGNLSEMRLQFQTLDAQEQSVWAGGVLGKGAMMEMLITLYQEKLSLLIKIKHEIIKVNNALPPDSILAAAPYYINL